MFSRNPLSCRDLPQMCYQPPPQQKLLVVVTRNWLILANFRSRSSFHFAFYILHSTCFIRCINPGKNSEAI
jgi:hypothetical protein